MTRPALAWLAGAAIVAAFLTFVVMQDRMSRAVERAEALQRVVTKSERTLLGYRNYTQFLEEGKRQLSAEQKLIAATVRQPNAVTLVLDTSVLGLRSTGTVAIWYSTEYSFGYDLASGKYDVRATSEGIEIRVDKPRLVATPAVTDLRYKVLSGGMLTDEKSAALRLYAEAANRAKIRGEAMASDAAIIALCEKQLTGFLRGFLQRQKGVDFVPHIRVVYR
jgi:hypothetical protein